MNEQVIKQIEKLKKDFECGLISYMTYWIEIQNILSNAKWCFN